MEVLRYSYSTLHELLQPHRIEFWFALSPILTYWLVAGLYDLLDHSSSKWVARHRIQRREPEGQRVNRVSRSHVCQRVLLQHGMQLAATLVVLVLDPKQCSGNPSVGWVRSSLQVRACVCVSATGLCMLAHVLISCCCSSYTALVCCTDRQVMSCNLSWPMIYVCC